MQYLITFCSRLEAASDVISGVFVGPIIFDISVRFRGPIIFRSREIIPEAVGSGVFEFFVVAIT